MGGVFVDEVLRRHLGGMLLYLRPSIRATPDNGSMAPRACTIRAVPPPLPELKSPTTLDRHSSTSLPRKRNNTNTGNNPSELDSGNNPPRNERRPLAQCGRT